MPPGPEAGYQPNFHMPIIAPPSSGSYDESYSRAIASVTPSEHDGLTIQLASPSYANLFAMTGGFISFIPAGELIPNTEGVSSPGAGSLLLQVWSVDMAKIQRDFSGAPPMALILYLNVRVDSVRSALERIVSTLPETFLLSTWSGTLSSPNRSEMETDYLSRVLLGEQSVFIEGGQLLGEAAQQDLADASSSREFTLCFLDSANNDLSPITHLRGLSTHGGRQWVNHPLAVLAATFPLPVNIYLKFEFWNEVQQVFQPLPEGIRIDLMDYDEISSDRLITELTDSNGYIHFRTTLEELESEAYEPLEEHADIFFVAQTNNRLVRLNEQTEITLPTQWSTYGWKSANNQPGYYESFVGTLIGSPESPIIFRVGLDFHIKIQYRNAATSNLESAPIGIPIEIFRLPFANALNDERLTTDSKGEIHGVVFNIEGGVDIALRVNFEMQDEQFNIKRAYAAPDGIFWDTNSDDADRKYYPNIDRTSIGTNMTPECFICTINDRNVSLYLLKIFREISTFLFYITDSGWDGFPEILGGEHLQITRSSPSEISYSFPIGQVNIAPNAHWNRGTIIHELSHQVMWKESNYSSLGIVYQGTFGNLFLYHRVDFLRNTTQALIEGWAEFMERVFNGEDYFNLEVVLDEAGDSQAIGPPPNNRGAEVEGTFSDGLLAVFREHIVDQNVNVQESQNGNIISIAANSWLLDPSVRQRFQQMIWQPLKDLSLIQNPTSIDMLERIKIRNPDQWHALLSTLQRFNLAMAEPRIVSVTPSQGLLNGGQAILIQGENFVLSGTEVTFGGVPGVGVQVTSHTSLTVSSPQFLSAGNVDLRVSTRAGNDVLTYIYQ